MTTKLFAVLLLTMALAGCDSTSTTENTPANRSSNPAASPNTTEPATPAPPSTSNMPSTSQFKPGDKVKATIAGKATDATVVSVDEKLGKVVVKLSSGEEKTVALSDVTKQ